MNLQTWSTKRSKEVNEVKVSAVSHLDGSDGLVAGGALGREDPVEVVDAVDLVVEVDGEGDAVEALVAHAAPEAAGVVRLAHRLQDLSGEIIQNWSAIRGTASSRRCTISMIRCPHIPHFSEVCWNPEY